MARGDGVLGQQGKGQCVSGFCVAGCGKVLCVSRIWVAGCVAGCGKVLCVSRICVAGCVVGCGKYCVCFGFVWLIVWLVELSADQQSEDRIVVCVQLFPISCS